MTPNTHSEIMEMEGAWEVMAVKIPMGRVQMAARAMATITCHQVMSLLGYNSTVRIDKARATIKMAAYHQSGHSG